MNQSKKLSEIKPPLTIINHQIVQSSIFPPNLIENFNYTALGISDTLYVLNRLIMVGLKHLVNEDSLSESLRHSIYIRTVSSFSSCLLF